MNIKSSVVAVLGSVLLAGCATAPPKQQNNLCEIFREKSGWYDDAKDMEEKWGTPIHVAMAIIKQESSFRHDAKPPKGSDVRGGHGLMTAIELVSDRETKAPAGKELPVKLQEAIYQNGTMVRVSGPNMIFSPPLIISKDEVDQVLAAVDAGFASL